MRRSFSLSRGPARLDLTRLFAILFGFCGGIILAELWAAPFGLMLGMLGVAAVVFLLLPSPLLKEEGRRWPRLIGVLCLALVIGVWRWQAWMEPGQHGLELLVGQHVWLTGSVVDAPTPRENQQEFELVDIESSRQSRTGKISVRLPAYPAVNLGERLTLRCEVKSFSDRNIIRQRLHDVRGYCSNPEIVESAAARSSLRLRLGQIKNWAVDRLTRQFTEPQSSLMIGILLGRQVPMPPDLDQAFRATGTTHIIALSGFNVTIIITALSAVLVRVVGKRWAWLPTLLFVAGFVVMTGASASVTRAGVMSSVVVLALRLGRPVSMLRLLAYTLLAMVWHNPLVLIHDLGFQLSFLATAGLVYVSPVIQSGLRFVPAAFSIRENLGTTLGAILMTEPLLLWNFARVSLVAPVVNVMILPLIPLAMAFGFMTLAVPPLWPMADVVLRRVIGAIQTGADLPFALQPVSGWGIGFMALVLSGLATILIYRNHARQVCVA